MAMVLAFVNELFTSDRAIYFEHFWICFERFAHFEMFARFSKFLDLSGRGRTCSDMFGCIRMQLDAFGCIRLLALSPVSSFVRSFVRGAHHSRRRQRQNRHRGSHDVNVDVDVALSDAIRPVTYTLAAILKLAPGKSV